MQSASTEVITHRFNVRNAACSLIVVGTLAAAGNNALAQAPPFAFAGSALIVARAGADCDSVSAQVGELHTAVFRPVQTGIGAASLQLFQDQTAFRIQPSAGGNFASSGAYAARMFGGRGGYLEYAGNYSRFVIRPNAPTSTTKVVDISGRLTNFRNAGSCTITFAAGFVLKP